MIVVKFRLYVVFVEFESLITPLSCADPLRLFLYNGIKPSITPIRANPPIINIIVTILL